MLCSKNRIVPTAILVGACLAFTGAAFGSAASAAPVAARAASCNGLPVTDFVPAGGALFIPAVPAANNVILGTNGPDLIKAGAGNDVVCAVAGNDRVDGEHGNDTIFGGDGRDRIAGGDGNDRLHGNNNDDTFNCGPGLDAASGGPGGDLDIGNPPCETFVQ